jgi:hypothetical protein
MLVAATRLGRMLWLRDAWSGALAGVEMASLPFRLLILITALQTVPAVSGLKGQ